MPVQTDMPPDNDFLGVFTLATLPAAGGNSSKMAYVTDVSGALMICNGTIWKTLTTKRVETYNGTTDASGNYSEVFPDPFTVVPHINPVTYPPADSTTRIRVTSVSTTGFTVKTEKNNTVTVLALDVLALGTANVASVPVRVVVVES